MKRRAETKLNLQASGKTLLDYLSGRFNYHSREEWQERIVKGELFLNDTPCCEPHQLLQEGMLLRYEPTNLVEPAVNGDYKIVFEDETLLVIDKPGNLPVHPAGPYFSNTLWAMLRQAGYSSLHLVNRLDRETSGLLIVAKSSEAAGILAKTLMDMQKKYLVAVHGVFPQELHAKGFLGKDIKSPIRKKQRYSAESDEIPDAQVVETHFTRIASNNDLSLVEAELFTGRMHQIRATLHSLHYPVVGDKLYGLNEEFYRRLALDTLSTDDRQALLLPRQALHCCALSFEHPVSGKTMQFTAPAPEEIMQLFK